MNLDLGGTVALVTGAGGGIGRATALELAREGAHVVVLDVRADASEETGELIRGEGGDALTVACDLTDTAALTAELARVAAWRGPVTAACLNAGIGGHGTVETLLVDEWRHILAVNLEANLHLLRAVLGPMRVAGGGSLVAVSSPGAVDAGHPSSSTAYGVSKAGLERLMLDIAVRHRADGIRANSVRPGPTDTDFAAHRLPGTGEHPPFRAPARRARPDEIAAPIAFLLSRCAALITGQTITLDGGPAVP